MSGPVLRVLRLGALLAAALGAALLAACAALWWLLLAPAPLVQPATAPTVEEVARARALWRLHDPRRSAPGQLRGASLVQADVDLLLSRLAGPWLGMPLKATLAGGRIELAGSAELHGLPGARRWLNVRARLDAHGGRLHLGDLHLGRLPVPGAMARPLLRWTAGRMALNAGLPGAPAQLDAAAQLLRSVAVEHGRLTLLYVWQPDLARRVLAGDVPADDSARLRAYAEALAGQLGDGSVGEALPLSRLLPPLFALAAQRSATRADAEREHRALLLTLALHATGRSAATLLPQARAWPPPVPRPLSLAGRIDFAQHFLISAFLALETGTPRSDAVGVYKELADTRGGSGFSFNDLAADRAGARFGELALRAPDLLRERLTPALADSDLLPPVADLPEFLDEPSFRSRYGGAGTPAYDALLAEIERRVADTPALR